MINSGAENEKKVFSLKQQVSDDIRRVQAMETAKTRAEELKQLIAKTDWDKAVEKYNSTYAPKDPNNAPAGAFRKLTVDTLKRQLVASESDISQIRKIMRDNPSAGFLQSRIVANMLNRRFFDLLAGKAHSGEISDIIEFTPGAAYYVARNVIRQPVTTEEYQQTKPFAAMRTSMNSASSLGLIHFDPKNIQKRLNYVQMKTPEVQALPIEE
jgi:hypothetical protein